MHNSSKLEDAVTGHCSGISITSAERGFESLNRKADEFNQVVQRWHEKSALERHSLAESYARNALAAICNLEMIVPRKGLRSGVRRNDQPVSDGKFFASVVYRSNTLDNRELAMSDQKPMLILDVEVMEVEKHLTLPSTVWLYPIYQESLDLFAGSLFQSSNGSFKCLLGFTERELGVSGRGSKDLNPSMIQCRSEVMDSISQDEDKFVWRGLSPSDAEDILSGLRIEFHREHVRVCIQEDLSERVNLIDVLLGPFNL